MSFSRSRVFKLCAHSVYVCRSEVPIYIFGHFLSLPPSLQYLCRLTASSSSTSFPFFRFGVVWTSLSIVRNEYHLNDKSKKKKSVLWQVIDDHILMNCSLCVRTMNFIIHGSLSFSFFSGFFLLRLLFGRRKALLASSWKLCSCVF